MTQSTVINDRPIGGQQGFSHWNSPKRQRTLSLSEDAWNLISNIAMSKGLNRSEVVEIMVRYVEAKGVDLPAARAELLA